MLSYKYTTFYIYYVTFLLKIQISAFKLLEIFENVIPEVDTADISEESTLFEDLGLRSPDYYLDAVGADLGETVGNIIAKSYNQSHKICI